MQHIIDSRESLTGRKFYDILQLGHGLKALAEKHIAENYADIVTSPEKAVSVIHDATNGKMADQLMECSGNPEVVGTLHKYIKDGGWEDDDLPVHIHLQGDYPDKIIFDHIIIPVQRLQMK